MDFGALGFPMTPAILALTKVLLPGCVPPPSSAPSPFISPGVGVGTQPPHWSPSWCPFSKVEMVSMLVTLTQDNDARRFQHLLTGP